MLSGRQTLASLDSGLRQLHDSVQEIDLQIKESSGELMELQRDQSQRFRRMAKIRLDEVISGELTEGLDAADERARELIRQRGSKLGAVNRQIRVAGEQLEALEEKRSAARGNCDEATEALDKAEARIQERLEEDTQYRAQLEKTRQSERTAEHALEKTRQAERTRREKGQPYESDPLFSYLWRRGYGTSAYSAGPLTRYLDGWVARLCGYQAARPNYAMLLQIPPRLDEHARHLQELADEEFIRLTRLEVDVSEAEGLPALRQSLDSAQAALDAIDDDIEKAENRLHELEQQRSRFANGEDEDFQQAVKTISDAFERENLLSLYEYARSTATTEDDILVREMDEVSDRLREAREMLSDRKRMRERQADRLKELEGIRRRFKRNRFDSPHSEFRNEALVQMSLGQFLAGTVTGGELWRTIERVQRYRKIRANPTFGSGGFRPRPGTWHTPFPRGGGLGGGLGGSLGRGSGGFGRGGGGFRTGGGF
jgi:chromosome segregation ATPase